MASAHGELRRLADIGDAPTTEQDGARAIARELARHGATGQRSSTRSCPLSRHLQRFTTETVQVTRYEVVIGDHTAKLNAAPGDFLRVKAFVAAFDDHPKKFRHLRE